MVLVKTAVYHAMGTLMPYPSEDPPRLLEVSRPDRRQLMLLAFSSLVSVPVGREASIASPGLACQCPDLGVPALSHVFNAQDLACAGRGMHLLTLSANS